MSDDADAGICVMAVAPDGEARTGRSVDVIAMAAISMVNISLLIGGCVYLLHCCRDVALSDIFLTRFPIINVFPFEQFGHRMFNDCMLKL